MIHEPILNVLQVATLYAFSFYSVWAGLLSKASISVMAYSKSLFSFVKDNAIQEGFRLDYEIKMFRILLIW